MRKATDVMSYVGKERGNSRIDADRSKNITTNVTDQNRMDKMDRISERLRAASGASDHREEQNSMAN